MDKQEYIFDYYRNIVKPTVNDFLQNKDDIRKGRIAAIVLDHMRDYWAIYLDRNREWSITEILLKEEIYDLCPDAALIRDVCNAKKHGILRESKNDKNIPKKLHSTNAIKAEENEGLFAGGFGSMFGESNYVFIKLENDTEIERTINDIRFLYEVVINVTAFWDAKLSSFYKC